MTETTTASVDHLLYGEWRQPVNLWQGAENSIHTDSVARRVGMRGGTIPGTVHLTHFQTILTELFGERWLERGSISMYYTFATTDGEDVRAIVERPALDATNVQLPARVENKEGRVVCKGTVSVGSPTAPSYIRSQPLEDERAGEMRILSGMTAGMPTPQRDDYRIIKGADEDGVIRDFQVMYRALSTFPEEIKTAPAVGFFGATEIVLHAGPLGANTPYRKTGRVVAFGASPKTEYAWIDSWLHDHDGRLIAEMRHMTRWMKVSSPLWAA
jgi:hypothetical protein